MILIVDDSATNLVLLEVILREEGYETLSAFNAKEAFKLMKSNKPELILLDLMMPEVTGFDFLKEIKKNPETSNIPVIVITAVGSKENQDICFNNGAAEFLTKPIDIHLFLEKVKLYVVL
jgi:CheY-like chemotaxis protein